MGACGAIPVIAAVVVLLVWLCDSEGGYERFLGTRHMHNKLDNSPAVSCVWRLLPMAQSIACREHGVLIDNDLATLALYDYPDGAAKDATVAMLFNKMHEVFM